MREWTKALRSPQTHSLFETEPVPLDIFIKDKGYLGLEGLSEIQFAFVKYGTQIYFKPEVEALSWEYLRPVTELVMQAGKGSGKDFVSRIILARIIYQLICLKNPQKYYNLDRDSSADLINMAYSSSQASEVFFLPFRRMVERSPCFKDKFESKEAVISFAKNIFAYSGHSQEESAEGKNLIACVLDEISAFKTNLEIEVYRRSRFRPPRYSAESLFDAMKSSINSRFPAVGKLISLSYPRFKGDFIQQLYNQGKNDPTVYVALGCTWDINPKRSKEDFADEFRRNPERARGKYMCEPSLSEDSFFKDTDILESTFPIISEDKNPVTNEYSPKLKDSFKCSHSLSCSIHIDLATKNDKAGFAMVHQNGYTKEEIIDPITKEKKIIRAPIIEVDLLTCFIAEANEEVVPYLDTEKVNTNKKIKREIEIQKLRNLIYQLSNRGFNIAVVSFDGFQSTDSMQILERDGYNVIYRSVDRNTMAYDDLKTLINEGRLKKAYTTNRRIGEGTENIILEELKGLVEINGRKVEHRVGGCFTGETKIILVSGEEVTFKDMTERYAKNEDFWIYAIDIKNEKIVPAKVRNPHITKKNVNICEVELDNGKTIKCTPDHLFMLRDGTYKRADTLQYGNSLMPIYVKYPKQGLDNYRMIYNPFTDKWHYEHRWFVGYVKRGYLVHHLDYNSKNNAPDNLIVLEKLEHLKYHNTYERDNKALGKKISAYYAKMKINPTKRYIEYCKKMSIAKSGQIPWSKGLTKENDERVRKASLKLSKTRKEKFANGGLITWSKGLGLEDPRMHKFIMAGAEASKKENRIHPPDCGCATCKAKRGEQRGKNNPNYGRHISVEQNQRMVATKAKNKALKLVKLNHKVISVKMLSEKEDVYDLEVPEYHNFALSAGVFVHNSKDLSDALSGACQGSIEIGGGITDMSLLLEGTNSRPSLLDMPVINKENIYADVGEYVGV